MAYWREDENTEFINPYNFVQLSSNPVVRTNGTTDAQKLFGVIQCSLVTRTPLIIPDFESLPEKQKKDAHKFGTNPGQGVPFFRKKKGGLPTIPGSEIRGAIRSVFETLDNGCLSINNSNVASSRSPIVRNPGVLEYDASKKKWALYKATMSWGTARGAQIERKWPKAKKSEKQLKEFYLTKGGVIKYLTSGQIQSAVDDYYTIVDITRKKDKRHTDKNGHNKTTVIPRPNRITGKMPSGAWPVFYQVVHAGTDAILYLSPAQIGRTVFHNRVDNLLESHKHCTDPKNTCETCRLFGMVSDNGALSSRLRFADATLVVEKGKTSKDYLQGGYILSELSSPKPSSVEFYTKRPLDERDKAAAMWTYDTATFEYEKNDNAERPESSTVKPKSRPYVKPSHMEIRGRKYYLHHPVEECHANQAGVLLRDDKNLIAQTKRNMTAEAVAPESTFTFKVYFDGITEVQLKKLVWTLCIGENDISSTSLQLHKLGHAKPLGFGSVKIHVDKVLLRNVGAEYGIQKWTYDVLNTSSLPNDADDRIDALLKTSPFDVDEAVRDFMVVTNWNLYAAAGGLVSYPKAIDKDAYEKAKTIRDKKERETKTKNSTATYQWFMGNRVIGKGSNNGMSPSIYRALPHLPKRVADGKVLVLPGLIKDPDSDSLVQLDPQIGKEATFTPKLGEVQEVGEDQTDGARNAPEPHNEPSGQQGVAKKENAEKSQAKSSQQTALKSNLGSRIKDPKTLEKLRAMGLL